jgi:starch synthase
MAAAASDPAAEPLRVLQASAEIYPLVKTGGLADVAGALPGALRRAGADLRLLLPGYPAILDALQPDDATPLELAAPWGGETARLRRGRLAPLDVPAWVIEHAPSFERAGGPYADAAGFAYADNHRRFAWLGLAAVRLACGLDPSWRPQVVHGHDWHAGLAPAYLAFARRRGETAALGVFTVHNLAYQGLFPAGLFGELGLPPEAYGMHGLEFHGQLSFMKAGLSYADRLTTVSPTYAREITTAEQGCGLDGLLRERAVRLTGILNGVDPAVWDPAADPLIAERYTARKLAGKAACKAALQRALGLAERPEAPLFTVVSRLTEQKGLHLLAHGAAELLRRGGQLALLGSGEPALEAAFRALAAERPDAAAVRIGYDETLSHRLFAGGDVTLVPSRFEPCGLTQMYGLKYGSLPLVHRVGGLADTVVDSALEELAEERATGFVFDRFDDASFGRAVRRAFALWARPAEWRRVQRRAMAQDLGWDASAARYLQLYREAAAA